MLGGLFTGPHHALVNPTASESGHTAWLAFISIKDELFGDYYVVCSGVLVDPEWVLSSQGCLVDPFESIEAISSQNEITYYIELWGQYGLFEVVDSIVSPDGRLVMHKLNRPAVVSPIKRSTLDNRNLLGARVEVPGLYESESLGNTWYNPPGKIEVSCRVRGELFFAGNSYCFIISPIYLLFPIGGNYGTVIDPETAGSLSSPLDDELNLKLTDDEIFIDFEDGGFPCHEDIGSPVVSRIQGEIQLVGLVTSVGIAARLPVCANSLYNIYSASHHYEEFIRQTLVRDVFDSDCPATAKIHLDELGDNRIRLSWTRLESAHGYKILFTPRLGYEPIQTVDVGDVTELSATIDPDSTYYVSVLAYNQNCTSQPANPLTILINKP